MSLLFAMMTVATNVALVAFAALALSARVSDGAAGVRDRVWDELAEIALPLAMVVAFGATLGSLYLSEVAHLASCTLCWFQRAAMYPLPLILLVATIRHDRSVWHYVVPIAAVGSLIAVYHYQLERFPKQGEFTSCSLDVPCTVTVLWRFHYISVPFMTLSTFLLIAALTWIAGQREDADVV